MAFYKCSFGCEVRLLLPLHPNPQAHSLIILTPLGCLDFYENVPFYYLETKYISFYNVNAFSHFISLFSRLWKRETKQEIKPRQGDHDLRGKEIWYTQWASKYSWALIITSKNKVHFYETSLAKNSQKVGQISRRKYKLSKVLLI